MSHQCPANGCGQTMPDHMLMCRPHWYMTPRPLRTAVWDAYRDGAGVGTPELARAQDLAIDAVNRKLAEAKP
jgi:hypothetical protein